jgi:hypothetical protein
LSPLLHPVGLLKNLHLCVSGGCCCSVVISGGVCGCGICGCSSSRGAGGSDGCRGRFLGKSMALRGVTLIFSCVYDSYFWWFVLVFVVVVVV